MVPVMHVDRRPLGRHDEVDAGGARLLRQALDGASISLPATSIRSAISSMMTTMKGSGSRSICSSSNIGRAGLGIDAGLNLAGQRLALALASPSRSL